MNGLPAVVLGIDSPIGLTIVRELGGHGVPVIGLGRSTAALGMASRHLHRGLVRANGDGALIDQLQQLGAQLGRACLYAIAETDIMLLNRQQHRLTAFVPMYADAVRMARVLDKTHTYAAAARLGLQVPRTVHITSPGALAGLTATLRFPVVLKWADPNHVAPALAAAGLTLDKTHYCQTAQQLDDYLRQYAPVGHYPLIQEYCAGYGLGQFILMHDGQPRYAFQHRRLHEWPPEGGVASLALSVPLAEHGALMAQSVALLRALDWDGVAMVEYRHDPASGSSALMEVNGRYWGSLPLASQAGAEFAWHSYQLLGLGRPVRQTAYTGGMRCRFMVPETKRLLRILFGQQHIADRHVRWRRLPALAGYLLDFLRPHTRYYVLRWSDPRPLFTDLGQMLAAAVRPLLRRPAQPRR